MARPSFPRPALPKRRVVRRVSLRALAAGQSSFRRRPVPRIGMTAVPPRARIAAWHLRASKAPSPITVPICSSGGDLIRKVRQNGAAARAARGELPAPDVAGGGVRCRVGRAVPAAAMRAMLAGKPLAITREPDPGAVRRQGQGARPHGGPTCRREWSSACGSGWRDRAPARRVAAICRMPATIPAGCRSTGPDSTFTMRQNSIAASQNTGGRPGRPAHGARPGMSLSRRIDRKPRRLGAALRDRRFVVRQRVGPGLVMAGPQPAGPLR